MTESLWDCTVDQLLERTASTDPTPGGGAIAAVTAAFGLGLVQMAVGITAATASTADAGREHEDKRESQAERLAAAQSRAHELQAQLIAAVDRDVEEFEAIMAGYRMPRDTDEHQAARRRAIAAATVTATHGPLSIAETAVAGIALADEIEPAVKPTIVSDVQAGRDLLRGAALAALRTADINLGALEEGGDAEAPALRERRDAVRRAATDAEQSR